ncbi:MAG: 4-hydroxy-tetrahydrodipicolinate reductase [Ruminococcus sp.]|nr:4-hydroxy-tetrahydrodipicolinate reductase [Ruminococcus sp.]
MVKILLTGCCGKMGHAITKAVSEREDCKIVCGVDVYNDNSYDYAVHDCFSEVTESIDVIIDFSNPGALSGMLEYIKKNKTPAVICTTGYSKEQVETIKEISKETAIFYSGNMSLGINLLIEISKQAAKVLGESFDIEIVEKHHNLKLDAPSGTALMIADGISTELSQEPQYVYDRHSYRRKRSKNEIGIHAVRGGTIVGEHEVIFAGHDEVVTISHQAQSKEVFAIGSINAAVFLSEQKPGMYDMSDLLSAKLG